MVIAPRADTPCSAVRVTIGLLFDAHVIQEREWPFEVGDKL